MSRDASASKNPSLPEVACFITASEERTCGRLNNPVCREATEGRTVASFEDIYLANVRDKKQGGDLRKNGRSRDSIVASSLFPFLQSMLHISPATLHIGISFGGMAVLRLEIGADIRDGKDYEADMGRIGEIAYPIAEPVVVNDEEAQDLSLEVLRERANRARLEREWAEISLNVEEFKRGKSRLRSGRAGTNCRTDQTCCCRLLGESGQSCKVPQQGSVAI